MKVLSFLNETQPCDDSAAWPSKAPIAIELRVASYNPSRGGGLIAGIPVIEQGLELKLSLFLLLGWKMGCR